MTRIHQLSRITSVTGLLLVALPSLYLCLGTYQDWQREPVYLASLLAALPLGVLLVIGELASRLRLLHCLAPSCLAASVAAMVVGSYYLNGAVFLGLDQASQNTWHLLPLFLNHYQTNASMLVAAIVASLHALLAGVRTLRSRKHSL